MKRIRVVIADDSSSARQFSTLLLSREPDFEVVGCAVDGEQAVELVSKLLPDVVLMDFNMPKMDGLVATARMMETTPSRILLMTAMGNDGRLNLAYAAIAAGALELVPKYQGAEPFEVWAKRLVATIRIMSEVPVVLRRPSSASGVHAAPNQRAPITAMGIVASTGGPALVGKIVAGLPKTLPIPLLVVQHIAPALVTSFVRWLSGLTSLSVELATDGGECLPGHVYVPPGGADLELKGGGALQVGPASGAHFSSGDRLLSSLAVVHNRLAGGLVLSGMGRDGAAGLLAIRQAGGLTAAQDEASSTVYGMPRAACELGAVMHILSAEKLSSFVANACHAPSVCSQGER